jgi:hypothetical protein
VYSTGYRATLILKRARTAQSVRRSRYACDHRETVTRKGEKRTFFAPSVRAGSGDQPASYRTPTKGSLPGIKRPGHKADHSTPSDVKGYERVKINLHSPNAFIA